MEEAEALQPVGSTVAEQRTQSPEGRPRLRYPLLDIGFGFSVNGMDGPEHLQHPVLCLGDGPPPGLELAQWSFCPTVGENTALLWHEL